MDERLQFVARRLAVNYKVIRQRREAGSVKQDVRSPLTIVIQLYGHSSPRVVITTWTEEGLKVCWRQI
jgi:hypothetical protein